MKKKRITYGVAGMMEYQAVIKVGKKNVNILFSDGSVTAMGTNPATFTTDNIILQIAIESSSDYKRGRIKTVNVIELDEELHIERPQHREAVSTEAVEQHAEVEETIAEESVEATEESESKTEELPKVEFTCNDDAKDYLEQTYGYVRSKLRNREDIIKAGKDNGVDIIFV